MRRLLALSALLLTSTACDLISGGDVAETPKPGPAPAPGDVVAVPQPGDPSAEEPTFTEDDCDKVEAGDPVPEGEFLSGTLACGDTIVGHTKGSGIQRFDTKFYERHHCTPATTEHDSGDERIYELKMPDGDHTANVYLDSPCENVDMAAILFNGDGLPTIDTTLLRCEMWPKPRGQAEHVKLVSKQASRWLIVVEGQGEAEGPFQLRVECNEGLN